MRDVSYEIPVYRSWPEKDYKIIGDIAHEDIDQDWDDDEIKGATRLAKRNGADAVVLRFGAEGGVLSITAIGSNRVPYLRAQTTALAIQWLTEEEIQRRRNLENEIRSFHHLADPTQPNKSTLDLLVKYFLQSRGDHAADVLEEEFVSAARRVTTDNPESLEGNWVFKAAIEEKRLVSRNSETFLGIARIVEQGESLSLISESGTVEMNFTGQRSGHSIQGEIGLGPHFLEGRGVAFPDKISLNFRSLGQSGIIQGNIILQRIISSSQSPQPETATQNENKVL